MAVNPPNAEQAKMLNNLLKSLIIVEQIEGLEHHSHL